MPFEAVIGLEVHVQLNTKTKIFCSCSTSFGETPNSNTCPVCLGLPGALPVLNKEVVKKAIQLGTAIEAHINQYSIFARKNYFYPDLPKAYQISQFEVPIVSDGKLEIDTKEGAKIVRIERAHMEEDAGKNIHEGSYSLVDLNRACTPLLEIVSKPDMKNSEEAIAYLKKLHAIVRFIGISDANMQEGNFRCDANVSIRPKGDEKLYTRVEIKNLNSFRFIAKAIEYEIERQSVAWENGRYNEEVVQETRLFDTAKGITLSMRNKEESADYRYFKDPDLYPVFIDEKLLKEAQKINELPGAKKIRYMKDFNLKEDDANLLVSDPLLAEYFESMLNLGVKAKTSVTWLCVELLGRLKAEVTLENCGISAHALGALAKRIDEGKISGKSAKDVLDRLLEEQGGDVDTLIEQMGLSQVNDTEAIVKVIEEVLKNNADKVLEYKSGKDKLFGFFVGQAMKNLKGANPSVVNAILKEKLD
ncbi:Asp-tRNA(Asn)/Glu-tRNA(Gln) amidotransferase subunit GatB [Helicobacter pylori]|uniref:Aspartyl/glutamyl-tRNA(Asn/Gln) amidotransferase subunit B n=1 Tax=Helicobacter pylori (strain J99 / ATCC 700824) TaxID=85963 RepID=GATB_HELPJ|nr:Asp-tRNA(Asn)/Glu-tRNA(Gln) amidotransferase subunit GatB [Helicobacter pylori]Q9ZLH6.1 RecName: Full=Aspartyl/glutamyl-tRNA(Asn/Gln) amidotransferase subunit B; Short=Asp/Glu-ADT subunit B [Helicobacter pylori J99]AAD06184.1 GLU-TRNA AMIDOTRANSFERASE, SUBUNIT B [Helicobacter pylori J99]AKE81409.1 glutamyl-tRNA amidotransferase [Helicobacter pylori J99]NPT21385.1 Asp-tRNA(Asn)/Glu-tRNA(Gln) amidotransferase subunit GatB [Helicobacter pylori]UGW75321.1 Asp-tRNA(Asn)/Glu-tRNA(Gln) amidotransf